MKKRIFITIGLLCSVLLTGCGAVSDGGQSTSQVSSASEAEATTLVAEYSNLVDTDAQEKVDALLADAGISAARREVFRNHVVQFNDSVDTAVLQSGFASGDLLSPKYDAYELQEQWAAVHPNFNGYNCRITAFSLLADFLNVGKDGDIRADELFMDQESLQQDPSALQKKSEKNAFLRLFSSVATEDTTDQTVHVQTIQKDWQERKIAFAESEKCSLITVWFHDRWSETENELSIGHAGVLLNCDDGLYFVEKLAFQEPYQVTKFQNREELQKYLLKKYDTAWGQDTAHPFVMENDHPLNQL